MLTPRAAVTQALRDAQQAVTLLQQALAGDGEFLTLPSAAMHLRLASHQVGELFEVFARDAVHAALEHA